MPLVPHQVVELFGLTWWFGVIATTAAVALVLRLARTSTPAAKTRISLALLSISVLEWVSVQTYAVATDRWTALEYLPLHLCSLTGLLAVIFLLRPRPWLFELVYYWGVPGSVHAILTPQLTLGDTPYLRADFYIGHGIVLVIALWAVAGLGYRPRPGSWWRVFLATQLLLPAVGLVNLALDSNYMFLMRPPVAANPLIVGEPPWHLIGYEIAALAHFALLYLPFRRRVTPRAAPSSDRWPPRDAQEADTR